MTIDPSEIKARYKKVERETDAAGRVIVVRRLRPAENMRATEFAGSDATAGTIRIACAVREVAGEPVEFPKTRRDVEALVDLLDAEGIEAAASALMRLMGLDKDGKPIKDEASAANLPVAQG